MLFFSSISDLESPYNSYWWIGARKIDGKLQWSSRKFGEFLATYTNWIPGEPNNSGGVEECMNLHGRYKFRWNDVGCSREFFYICEKDKNLNDVCICVYQIRINKALFESSAWSFSTFTVVEVHLLQLLVCLL